MLILLIIIIFFILLVLVGLFGYKKSEFFDDNVTNNYLFKNQYLLVNKNNKINKQFIKDLNELIVGNFILYVGEDIEYVYKTKY